MRTPGIAHVAAAVPVVALMLSGCAGTVQTATCVSWAGFETAQDAFDDATVVLVGEAAPATTTTELYGVRAAVHEVAVHEVLKGELPGPGQVPVASTPVTCTGGDDVYPDGDPLDVEGRVIVFLTTSESGDTWRTLTPTDGVLPVPAEGRLPFETGQDPT